MAQHHCRDWERGRIATAGDGLPDLEPGMPVPAGTGLTRRSLLLRGAGLALAVYGGRALAPQAVEEALASAGGRHPVLVSVFLDGGADSLSILAPTQDARYRALRPTLALPEGAGTAFAADPRLRWHPAADGLRALWDDPGVGMAVLPAVGSSSPNQSHFTMRHLWQVGSMDVTASTGWLGRYLDVVGAPELPIQGLSLSSQLSPALAARSVPVSAARRVGAYAFNARGAGATTNARVQATLRTLGTVPTADPQLAAVRGAQRAASGLADDLGLAAGAAATPAEAQALYPGTGSDLEVRLKGLAQLLAVRTGGGTALPLRVVTVNAHGGWDTHAGQAAPFEANLQTTARCLRAFWRDLELRGEADRVVVHVWSEFGRRVGENGSGGTDHGAAGVSFLFGQRVRQGLVGEFPGLATGSGGGVDAGGNLRATVDFRSVYDGLLRGHLGADPAQVLPDAGRLAPVELFA